MDISSLVVQLTPNVGAHVLLIPTTQIQNFMVGLVAKKTTQPFTITNMENWNLKPGQIVYLNLTHTKTIYVVLEVKKYDHIKALLLDSNANNPKYIYTEQENGSIITLFGSFVEMLEVN